MAKNENKAEEQIVREEQGAAPAEINPGREKYPTWTDILALLGIFIVASLIAIFMLNILEKTGSASYGFAVFISYLIQFFIVILFAVSQKRYRAPEDRPVLKFSFKKVNPAITLWGFIMVTAMSFVVEPIVEFFPDTYLESVSRLMGAGGWMMLTMLVAAPFLEEMLFRGVVQESLTKKYGTLRGILIASAVFGVIHINPPQAVNAFFIALILGYIYHMTQSLVPVIFIHAVNNAIAYFSWMMNGEKIVRTSEMITNPMLYHILYAISCVIVLIAFITVYRTIKREPQPL